jgi:hypothetical protein
MDEERTQFIGQTTYAVPAAAGTAVAVPAVAASRNSSSSKNGVEEERGGVNACDSNHHRLFSSWMASRQFLKVD